LYFAYYRTFFYLCRHPPAATVTSGQMSPRPTSRPSPVSSPRPAGRPSPVSSPRPQPGSSTSHQPPVDAAGRDSPVPGSSRDSTGSRGGTTTTAGGRMGQGFQLRETASFLNGLPPEVFGKPHAFFRPGNFSHFLPGGCGFGSIIRNDADSSVRIDEKVNKSSCFFPLFKLFSRE
jgi:hypothetical protein